MVIFKWDKSLELGIPLIDKQHKQIFEYANAFFISYKCGETHAKTRGCLDFLQQYVLYHFQAEEAFQVDCHFPEYRDHQAKHSYLSTQVKFLSVKLTSSNFEKTCVDEFNLFINNWIKNHILLDDIKFVEYYKSHSASQNDRQTDNKVPNEKPVTL